MSSNKTILILISIFFIFSIISFIRLFLVLSKNTSEPIPNHTCPDDTTQEIINKPLNPKTEQDILSPKEHHLVSDLISHKSPCNLLIFGFKPQLISLAKLNTGGTTVFLVDDQIHSNNEGMKTYLVTSHEQAKKAYELLEHARGQGECWDRIGIDLDGSKCRLLLKDLPRIAYEKEWDIVVVDGPKGDRPEGAGRMGSIYTAALIARAGEKSTDVFVHDADRTIEKWYSWEFLCRENLVNSKGKLWHFRITGNSSFGNFCSNAVHRIL